MKKIYQEIKQATATFGRHCWQYLCLFLSADLITQFGWLPLFRLISTWLLQAAEVPFVSWQNVALIFQRHPLVVLLLVTELLCLLAVIYFQVAFVMLGVSDISRGIISIRALLRQVWDRVRHLRFGTLLVVLVDLIWLMPFAVACFRTPLLATVTLPQLVLDYLTRSSLLTTILLVGYLLIFILGVRLAFALPQMVITGAAPWAAIVSSWRATSHYAWRPLLIRLLAIIAIAALGMAILAAALLSCQWLLDLLPRPLPFSSAHLTLFLAQSGSELLAAWAGTLAIRLVSRPQAASPGSISNLRQSTAFRWLTATAAVLFVLTTVFNDGRYFQNNAGRRPVTISHRGVADENGVQNTIPALNRTHRLHPDYVEMDVHETKDHQFVVLHDENLRELAGVNKTPHQLTLRQLTKLTARENGQHARIVSFSSYLRAADRLHQKLLVEVKTAPGDSAGMLTRFDRRYGKQLIRQHDRVHSLDYRVVQRLPRLDPRLPVLYIQPYNFTYPNRFAAGYSMEYSTLTAGFINAAHQQGKQVYAWTVNKPAEMKQMMYEGADGVITDNLVELNRAKRDYENHHSYARWLLSYLEAFPIGDSALLKTF